MLKIVFSAKADFTNKKLCDWIKLKIVESVNKPLMCMVKMTNAFEAIYK